VPAFKVGVLDDAIKKGDKAALDYYNVPAKHWTNKSWDEINMEKVDIGLHSDPTASGYQAADRRLTQRLVGGIGVDDTKDLRLHVGNELIAEDVGKWDNPQFAYQGILNALEDFGDWDTAQQFAEEFSSVSSGSTIKGNADAVGDMARMRDFLLANEYDTITYKNTSEGIDAASDAYLNNPEWKALEADITAQEKDLSARAAELYRAGAVDDGVSGTNWTDRNLEQQYNDLIEQASALDDELEYARSDFMEAAADDNVSYISLDPGNVRSADAAFSKESIGKPGMMKSLIGGSATLGALGAMSPQDAAAATGDVINSAAMMIPNDVLSGSQMISNAMYGTSDTAPQLPTGYTGVGRQLQSAIGEDFGRAVNSAGLFGDQFGLPSTADVIGGVADVYNEYFSPHLSDRFEQGLGGALLAGSAMIPGSKTTNTAVDVGTELTRLGKQTKASSRKSAEIQAAQVREALAAENNYRTKAENVVDLKSLPVISRRELEGGVLMPTAGDMTMKGNLTMSSGIPVNSELYGGPGHGAFYGDWESTKSIANSYQDKVRKVARDAETDKIFGSYNPMSLSSSNFSVMPANVALQQLDTLRNAGARFDPAMISELDAKVRDAGKTDSGKYPNKDFPGVLDSDAIAYMMEQSPRSVTARKSMLAGMAGAPYRDAGFPLIDQIYRDVSYPDLYDRAAGETGDLILRLDPSASATKDLTGRNPSYGTKIPGGGDPARFASTDQFQNIYPDAWSMLDGVMTESKLNKKTGNWSVPRLLNERERVNTVNWNKPGKKAKTTGYQRLDNQLLDYMEMMGLIKP